jgi:hypothetical protein
MLFDEFAVDVSAVGAAEVFQEGVVEDGDDEGVLAADSEIVYLDVVIRLTAYRRSFLGEREFPLHGTVQA